MATSTSPASNSTATGSGASRRARTPGDAAAMSVIGALYRKPANVPCYRPRASGFAARVREEELLSVNPVIRDDCLTARGQQPVDELLSEVRLDVRVLRRVDEHHAILVEQAL